MAKLDRHPKANQFKFTNSELEPQKERKVENRNHSNLGIKGLACQIPKKTRKNIHSTELISIKSPAKTFRISDSNMHRIH